MQEASEGVHEVFFDQFLVGFLQVVFQWERGMWIRGVPHFWVKSLEANVCVFSFFSLLLTINMVLIPILSKISDSADSTSILARLMLELG